MKNFIRKVGFGLGPNDEVPNDPLKWATEQFNNVPKIIWTGKIYKEKELRKQKINKLISQFEFEALLNIKAKHLSGGQKKKLVIAIALINDPKILLLDEPFAALDILTIRMLQEIM